MFSPKTAYISLLLFQIGVYNTFLYKFTKEEETGYPFLFSLSFSLLNSHKVELKQHLLHVQYNCNSTNISVRLAFSF